MRRTARRWLIILIAVAVACAALIVRRMPEVVAWRRYLKAGVPKMATGPIAPVGPLRWFDDYYVVATLGDGAYAIGEPRYGQCNFSYLIVGSQRALLFDTGPGIRDIRKVIASLTALPIIALPSHLHFDHIGNLPRFADVALPNLPALRKQWHGGQFTLGFYLNITIIEKRKKERRATRFGTECSHGCHDPVRKSVSSLAVTSGCSSGKKCPLLSTLTMRTFEAFGAREAFSHS